MKQSSVTYSGAVDNLAPAGSGIRTDIVMSSQFDWWERFIRGMIPVLLKNMISLIRLFTSMTDYHLTPAVCTGCWVSGSGLTQ